MSENKPEESLDSSIQKFKELYEKSTQRDWITRNLFFNIDEDEGISLYGLAKKIVDRLTPEVLASKDDERFHMFGHQLTTLFKYAQDKDALLKIAKAYEELADGSKDKGIGNVYALYYYAMKNYQLSGDKESIIGFIGRVMQKRHGFYSGVSALKKLANPPRDLIDIAYEQATVFGKTELTVGLRD